MGLGTNKNLQAELAIALVNSTVKSHFEDGRMLPFIPANQIDSLTTAKNIKLTLGDTIPQELAVYIHQYAKKVFLLTFRCLHPDIKLIVESMQSLQRHGFTDEILPVDELPITRYSEIARCEVTWPPTPWEPFKPHDFANYQWMFIAPNFRVGENVYQLPNFRSEYKLPRLRFGQYEYNLPQGCIIPAVEKSGEDRRGYFSIVYRVKMHNAHCEPGSEEVSLRWVCKTACMRLHTEKLLITQGSYQANQTERVENDKIKTDEEWAKEARSLAEIQSLNHTHIIKCLAAIRHGERRYFMFPWANGNNLRDFWTAIPKQSPTPSVVVQAVQQLYHLADALWCLHNFQREDPEAHELTEVTSTAPQLRLEDEEVNIEDGITPIRHGDLKPENILRFISNPSDPNDLGILKIADMGLAKRHVQATEARQNATSTAYGTFAYEPPEAHHSLAPRSRLYDIWSMGCITLEYIIWILYGSDGLKRFYRQMNSAHNQDVCQYFEMVRTKEETTANVHRIVRHWMKYIDEEDPECSQPSAIKDLLKLVRTRLLVVTLPPHRPSSRGGSLQPVAPGTQLRENDADGVGRYRATAEGFRDSLKAILDRMRYPEYATTNKSRVGIGEGPNESHGSDAALESGTQPVVELATRSKETKVAADFLGRNLTASFPNSTTRRDYTVPPMGEWEFPVDNDFAGLVWDRLNIDISRHEELAPAPADRLCKSCSDLKFFDGAFSIEVNVSALRVQYQACDFCKMLADIIAKRFRRLNRDAPDRVQFVRKRSALLLDGYSKTPDITIFRSRGLQSPGDIQLGFPRPPQPQTGLYYRLLNLWLEDCVNKHPDCRRTKRDFLPTRLVDVGTAEIPRLRLVDTADLSAQEKQHGKYIAVSHQWGIESEHRPFVTRRDSVKSFMSQIPVDDLPATVRDAVEMTRKLGVQYLWIDTLCIVQGKDGDFNSEAPRMEDVYNCAYCVLATSRTTGQRDEFLNPQARGTACVAFQHGAGNTLYMCETMDDFHGDVLESDHAKRGWVLQERALARRTIFFAKNQTYFECGEGVRCQTLTKMHSNMADFLGDPNFPNKAMNSNRGVKIRYFQDLYMTYSRLQFSRISDRPFGISGIDSRLRKAYKTKGGWGIFDDGTGKGFFHRSLLWRRGDDEPLDPGMTPFDMPADRVIHVPSWSWMGRRGGIEYLDPLFDQTEWVKDIETPWTVRKAGLSTSERRASITPSSGPTTMELVATIRDYNVSGHQTGEVNILFDAAELRGRSDGAVRTRCLVVAKASAAKDTGQTDDSRIHYVLLVVPNRSPAEKLGPITYKRIGAATMLGKFISEAGERVRIQ